MRLPPPKIVEHEGFLVVRDDLIAGGTKARVIPLLFDRRQEYVYASPVQGYAQVALAHCCRMHGKRATIFCAKRSIRYARTIEAESSGAAIKEVSPGYLSVVKKRAFDYCHRFNARLLPWGLDCQEIIEGITDVARSLPINPTEVWSVAGSGVLTRALQQAWPNARFFAVQVGAAPNAGQATVIKAAEKFEIAAKNPPPYPSCENYDAKLWVWVNRYARPGALVWNVK